MALEASETAPKLEPVSTTTSYQPPTISRWRIRVVMVSLCLTLFTSALDTTIVATALPSITSELHSSTSQYAWVGSSYTLASTAGTPLWAKASDILGRKACVVAAAIVFFIGSLVAALSQSMPMLIASRTLQGLGGGGSQVLVTIVIGDMFTLEQRPKYYGVTGMVYALASVGGPLIGGILSQTIGWRWCFYINLPIIGVAIGNILLALDIKVDREPILESIRRLDYPGLLLITGGTLCFLYGLETGSSGIDSWTSAQCISPLVVGIAVLFAFVLWEGRFATNPLIPLRIFRKATNAASLVLACIHSFCFIGYDFFLPLYFQVLLGFSPLLSGLTLFALIVPLSLVVMLAGWFIKKTKTYVPVIYTGSILMTIGTGLFISFGTQTEWAKLISFEVIAGLGAGVLFQSPMLALQNHTRQQDLAAAMSSMQFLRSLWISISIVAGTTILQGRLNEDMEMEQGLSSKLKSHSAKEAYASALRVLWIFYTSIAAVMIVAAILVQPPRKPRERQADTHSPRAVTAYDNETEPIG